MSFFSTLDPKKNEELLLFRPEPGLSTDFPNNPYGPPGKPHFVGIQIMLCLYWFQFNGILLGPLLLGQVQNHPFNPNLKAAYKIMT